MKISLKDADHFEREGFTGDVYVATEAGRGFNALHVDCLTNHYKTLLKKAARAYLVLEGSGSFTINGERHAVEPYDFFLLGDGDVYEYEGKMRLFEFNVPGTSSENEEKLD